MTEATMYVTQSKYFSAAFNAAIFDGPLRIYFAQHQEAQALKVYFYLQQKLQLASPDARSRLKNQGSNVFVMLYPNEEMFDVSFATADTGSGAVAFPWIARERLGKDYVIGVRGPLDENRSQDLYKEMNELLA
jgi:hypothetical protein